MTLNLARALPPVEFPPPVDPQTNTARLEMCGQMRELTEPDGKLGFRRYYCGYYRTCNHCMQRRINERLARVDAAVAETGKPLTYYHLNPEHKAEIAKYCAKISGAHYMRMPLEDGSIGLLIDADTLMPNENWVLDTTSIDQFTTDQLAWNDLCNTPYKQRMTGKLGLQESPVPADDMIEVIVETVTVVTNAEINDRVASYWQAVAESSDDEHTPVMSENADVYLVSLLKAMNYRTERYAEQLKARGQEVFTMTREVTIKINRNYNKRSWLRTISKPDDTDFLACIHQSTAWSHGVREHNTLNKPIISQ